MSRRRFFGGTVDRAYFSSSQKSPRWKVVIWNPNRTTINQVVLGEARSPEYDISPHVVEIDYSENITFENTEDSVATHCTLVLEYNRNARPIEITERTMLDGTPIRIFQGDSRVPEDDWIPVFTGVIRGNPKVAEFIRNAEDQKTLSILAVDRSEAFLNTNVTAFSYDKGEDIGKAVVETAIQFMGLDRREINIGFQDYAIGHPQSQLVDIEIMKGLAQMLFVTGKKPKFDSDGFFVAADTDIHKAPARIHEDMTLVVSIIRDAVSTQINNSVRLLGIDDLLTEILEREKRIAFGTITSGFFEDSVREFVNFSRGKDKTQEAARAKDTRGEFKITSLGQFFGESASWQPILEDDGYTCFGGHVVFRTGYDPQLRIAAIVGYAALTLAGWILMLTDLPQVAAPVLLSADLALIAILLSVSEIGRVVFEIHGKPFQNVFQQIVATEQLSGVLTSQIRELEIRNDWFYDIPVMQVRCKELLIRELIKGFVYEIALVDDPVIEVDDVIQIEDRKYYITSIRKRLSRSAGEQCIMSLTTWRFE